jgi:hypothetical protein
LDFSKSLIPKIKRANTVSVEVLENRPVANLLLNHPNFKVAPATAPTKSTSAKTERSKKPKRLPNGVTWDPVNPHPPKDLDPERWLPMKQRSYYVPPPVETNSGKSKAAKRKKKLAKEREQLSTQGAAEPTKSSGGASGGGGKSKKKGKK